MQFGSTENFLLIMKCVLCFCGFRLSSRLENKSLALMSKCLSPSSETAAQLTWGKVCLLVSELNRRPNHSQYDLTDTTLCGPFSVFDAYMKMTGYEMEQSIQRETSGSLQDLLLAVGAYRWRCFIGQTFNGTLQHFLHQWLFFSSF